jgi:hypothetical protein
MNGSLGMLANMKPTFTALGTLCFYLGEQEMSITLVQETHGYGQRSEFYCLCNGYRIRPETPATTYQAGKLWYQSLLSLYTQARLANVV